MGICRNFSEGFSHQNHKAIRKVKVGVFSGGRNLVKIFWLVGLIVVSRNGWVQEKMVENMGILSFDSRSKRKS